jgi:hypothetical protein
VKPQKRRLSTRRRRKHNLNSKHIPIGPLLVQSIVKIKKNKKKPKTASTAHARRHPRRKRDEAVEAIETFRLG